MREGAARKGEAVDEARLAALKATIVETFERQSDAFYTSGPPPRRRHHRPARHAPRRSPWRSPSATRQRGAHCSRCSSASPGPEHDKETSHADHPRARGDPAHAEALHRRGDQPARRRVGSRRGVPGAHRVQAARRARPARPHQAREVRRHGARLLVLDRHGRDARPRRLRRRADGDRRADRHVHAGARPLRLGGALPRVPGAGDRRRRGRLHRRLRARRRLRRGEHQDHGAQGRRRLRHQRRQDVDHQQPAGRLDVPARQHLRRAPRTRTRA